MKCAYCEHRYDGLTRLPPFTADVNREVFEHVRLEHPGRWGMVKPNDRWVTE
jgi:hypothetical protein